MLHNTGHSNFVEMLVWIDKMLPNGDRSYVKGDAQPPKPDMSILANAFAARYRYYLNEPNLTTAPLTPDQLGPIIGAALEDTLADFGIRRAK